MVEGGEGGVGRWVKECCHVAELQGERMRSSDPTCMHGCLNMLAQIGESHTRLPGVTAAESLANSVGMRTLWKNTL